MGDVLSLAMDKRKETFPRLLINMIKTAEMTGNLTETLDDILINIKYTSPINFNKLYTYYIIPKIWGGGYRLCKC